MKNIHILLASQPSRLRITSKNKLILSTIPMGSKGENKDIYITNDEIITDYSTGLYFIDVYTGKNDVFNPIYINKDTIAAGKFHTYMNNGSMCKKIILTTDQDLINDGVQAIDDEFLEWFVKNPSCEEVEVKNIPFYEDNDYNKYKIIIPKEEPKTNLERLPFSELIKEQAEYYRNIKLVEKQETTLEEVAERLYPTDYGIKSKDIINIIKQDTFINGAKWQQERSYSEEDLDHLFSYIDSKSYHLNDDTMFVVKVSDIKKAFKQFKKK
tara:strand:+ start:876 stop:1682 length:807 start_codon:yes stop_codon:yes gene_type:complete